ncbi:MAG: putative fluoride ion transporter CrcB [Paracidovorax wautersii]|uniref:Fluoride-specific ion channel FluC n=1 Tax=Paracidovorax wautersii TaxID=1177982 RepID=A0A7V8FKQ2_9BURK|nr:MAG: putative fluoride ion transporter CrcB [Paracidovorax wautersii]
MTAVLYVAVGGALGSVARYLMGSALATQAVQWGLRFPVGTFAVNLIGCLFIGLVAGLADKHALIAADARLLLVTGVLGGYTTFSSFGLETVMLLKGGNIGLALAYVLGSVVLGVALVALGWWLTGPAA